MDTNALPPAALASEDDPRMPRQPLDIRSHFSGVHTRISAFSNTLWSWCVSPESSSTFHSRGGDPSRRPQSFNRSRANALSGAI